MEGNLEGNFAGKNSGEKEKRKFRVMEKEIIFWEWKHLSHCAFPSRKYINFVSLNVYILCSRQYFAIFYGFVSYWLQPMAV
jgi:hypothetical protein